MTRTANDFCQHLDNFKTLSEKVDGINNATMESLMNRVQSAGSKAERDAAIRDVQDFTVQMACQSAQVLGAICALEYACGERDDLLGLEEAITQWTAQNSDGSLAESLGDLDAE